MPENKLQPDQIAGLQRLLSLLDPQSLTKEDFLTQFKTVIEHVKQIEAGNIKEFDAIRSTLALFATKLKEDATADIGTQKTEAQAPIASELARFTALIDTKTTPLDQRISAIKQIDEPAMLERFLGAINLPEQKEILLDTPEDIRNKLELLDGEERLDAKYIKNLPKPETTIYGGVNHGPLWALTDVDVTGITVGQSLKWDGIRWIPFTPSGGGGNTSVFGETPADTGDQTNFTLAHTPAAGTVRLYRGGAYQQGGIGKDYTISGATITLSVVLATGEILQADYEY